MKPEISDQLRKNIERTVRMALEEDIGSGDITAKLIPEAHRGSAVVTSREDAVMCGRAWLEEVYRQLDARVDIEWLKADGDDIRAGETLCRLAGPARSLLTGERTALNFLQLLCGTATTSRDYAALIKDAKAVVLDTRKTIPGLRLAQKYAVAVGGCKNHRIGLYDAFLIKENHIAACGSIAEAVAAARRQAPDKPVEVEVETLTELEQAITAGADTVMLDNFSLEQMEQGVALAAGRVKLEASGNVSEGNLATLAATGVDFISVGGLTKHLRAVDLSFRLVG